MGSIFHFLLRLRRSLSQAIQFRIRIYLCSLNILADIALVLLAQQPAPSIYVLKLDIFAGVSLITSHYYWKQYTIPDAYIFQLDIGDVDSGLSFAVAFRIKGIQHAAGASLIGLLLLLRTEVDCPPNWLMHSDVLIEDVIDDAIAICAWVSFEVDAFEGFLHDCIAEGDVAYTVDFRVGRNSADGESHSQSNSDIFNEHVFSAVGVSVIVVMSRLWHNYIIIVLTGDVEDMKIPAIRIDAISIEREERHSSDEVEAFKDVKLCSRIHPDIDVINDHIKRLIDLDVEIGRVLHSEVMDGEICGLVYRYQVRSMRPRRHVLFSDEPTIQPPNVTAPINLPSASNSQVIAKFNANEVLIADSAVLSAWPVLNPVAGCHLALDFHDNMIAVVDGDGKSVELSPRNHHNSRIAN